MTRTQDPNPTGEGLSLVVMMMMIWFVFQTKFNMTLDHRSRIFQNLNGAIGKKPFLGRLCWAGSWFFPV